VELPLGIILIVTFFWVCWSVGGDERVVLLGGILSVVLYFLCWCRWVFN